MRKVIVYGMGEFYSRVKCRLKSEVEIVAYANTTVEISTSRTGNLFEGKRILAPSEIQDYEFDYVYICTEERNATPIFEKLLKNGIECSKIQALWKENAVDGKWEDIPLDSEDGIISDINGIKILQKYHTDFKFVPEIFYNNAYYLEMGQYESVVIDIGMNIGIASLYFAAKPEVKVVYGFEPFDDTYSQAVANFELNDRNISEKIKPYNFGLTDKDEERDIAISIEDSGLRILSVPATEDNSVHIVCKSAGRVVRKIVNQNVGRKIILKIDTEGSEYDIFNSLEEYSCFDDVDAILMEYHKGADELLNILRRHSYKIILNGPKNAVGLLYAIK